MNTYTLHLTASQAEDLFYCVSSATTNALLDDNEHLFEALNRLRKFLIDEGFSVAME